MSFFLFFCLYVLEYFKNRSFDVRQTRVFCLGRAVPNLAQFGHNMFNINKL